MSVEIGRLQDDEHSGVNLNPTDNRHGLADPIDPVDHHHDEEQHDNILPEHEPLEENNWINSFLLARNQAGQSFNYTLILLNISGFTTVGAIAYFAKTGEIYPLFGLIALEIIMDYITLLLYRAYPHKFNILSDEDKFKVETVEKSIMACKFILGVIFYISMYVLSAWIGLLGMIVGFYLNHLYKGLTYHKCYESIFKMYFMPSGLMLFLNIHKATNLPLWLVFLMQQIIGYIFIIGFTVFIIFLVIMLFRPEQRRAPIFFNFTVAIKGLQYGLVALAIKPHFQGSVNWTGLDLYHASIYYLVPFFTFFWVTMAMRNINATIDLNDLRQNRITNKQGLNYVLNLVQKGPTLFGMSTGGQTGDQTIPAEATGQGAGGITGTNIADDQIQQSEGAECVVCIEKVNECLVFPCMHTGICRACALEYLKKKNTCMYCRGPITKIAVIQKISEKEYRVTEEITTN